MVADLGSVSAILIGGDIAFKGAPEEYETALVWIRELAAVAGCPLERVFVVPGNHDVDRGVIQRTPATRNVQAAISRASAGHRERELRTQIMDVDTGRALLAPISAYNEFAKLLNCQVYLPDRLYWKQDLDLGHGVILRVHGLTSTLLSGTAGDDTRDSLYLSPLQTVLDPADDVVNLVLCHHPPDWFIDGDDVNDAICGRAAIHMFGHKHRQRIQEDRQYVRLSAGAVNPDRRELGWIPGYNLIDVQVSGTGNDRHLTFATHQRQWQTNPDMFRAVTTRDGGTVFNHWIPFPGADGPAVEPPRVITTPPSDAGLIADAAVQRGLDGEAAMGDASTRNLVFRFWNLRSSERREIALHLGLINDADVAAPEAERYGRALIRASERGLLDELAREIAKREAGDGR